PPKDRPGDDAGEVEAEDDEAHRRTRAGQLQHEPEQGDDGELVAEIRDAEPKPKPLERGLAQLSANSSGPTCHSEQSEESWQQSQIPRKLGMPPRDRSLAGSG